MFIAVSSFGESLRRVLLTAPAEAILTTHGLMQLKEKWLGLARRRQDNGEHGTLTW